MPRPLLLLLSALFASSAAFKFLVYNPQIGSSHVNFMSKLTGTLIDAGHEVVMLSPITDNYAGAPKTKARVIEVPQCEYSAAFIQQMVSNAGSMASVWKSTDTYSQLTQQYRPKMKHYTHQCDATLSDKAMLQRLRDEKFDAAFTECIDNCGYALFHLLGIEKYATTLSMALMDGHFRVMQTPASSAYVPSMMGGKYGDRMTFMERLYNTFNSLSFSHILIEDSLDYFQDVVGPRLGNAHIRDMMAASSLVFLNSDPLADFPKLTSARVIDIGGISVHDGFKPVDEVRGTVIAVENRKLAVLVGDATVLLSFGTWVKSYLMPQEYKETVRNTIKKFPNVTFIWKYEKPEDNISARLENVVETTWAPQTDLLHDERLTAFITHGGQGSITESASAGVPLICIPVTADQFRNGRQVERNGVGVMIEKEALALEGPLETAIRSVISEESYRNNARQLAQMVADRPFAMKDVFVRNMEFLAKYGPLDRLQHAGANLNVFQYYLIDVFALLACAALFITIFVLYAVRWTLSTILELTLAFTAIRRLMSGRNRLSRVKHNVNDVLVALERCYPPVTFTYPQLEHVQYPAVAPSTLFIIDSEAFYSTGSLNIPQECAELVNAQESRALNFLIVRGDVVKVKAMMKKAIEELRMQRRRTDSSPLPPSQVAVAAEEVFVECAPYEQNQAGSTVVVTRVRAVMMRACDGLLLDDTALASFMGEMKMQPNINRMCLRLLTYDANLDAGKTKNNTVFVDSTTDIAAIERSLSTVAARCSANRLSTLSSLSRHLTSQLRILQANQDDKWANYKVYQKLLTVDGTKRAVEGVTQPRKRKSQD